MTQTKAQCAARRARLITAGKCGWCGHSRGKHRWCCDSCAEKHRARQHAKKVAIVAAGVPCTGCGKPVAVCVPLSPGGLCRRCYEGVRPGTRQQVEQLVAVDPIAPPVVLDTPAPAIHAAPSIDRTPYLIIGTRLDGDRLVIEEITGQAAAEQIAAQYREHLEDYTSIVSVKVPADVEKEKQHVSAS